MDALRPAFKRDATARAVALLVALLVAAPHAPAAKAAARQDRCAEFRRAVAATYDFKPSRLTDAERGAKSEAMDRFWKAAEAKPAETLPCLREALGDPQSDPWFRFDGSNLLVTLDPSPASKAEQVRQYAAVDLDDVDLSWWVAKLAERGAEGFDVSEAGARWLAYPRAEYYLARHGSYKVDKFLGAIFIFGSMDEAAATPALLKIAGTAGHPGREVALSLLHMQATPEAVRGLKGLDLAGLSPRTQALLRERLERPPRIAPRAKPKTSREQFLKAFNEAAKGDWKYFSELVSEVPDGEKDVVAVLKAEDVPLVRHVRRQMIARATPHAAEFYVSFTQILATMTWQPDVVK